MRRFHAVEGTLRLDPTEHEPEEMTRTVLEWLGNQSEMSDKKKPGS
jgi:hypothetical protein